MHKEFIYNKKEFDEDDAKTLARLARDTHSFLMQHYDYFSAFDLINVYYDKEDVSDLVSSIENSKNWILSTKIKSELKILLPSQFRAKEDLYYSVYNKTSNEYNVIPNESGIYEIYAMSYDKNKKELIIHKYKLMYNK